MSTRHKTLVVFFHPRMQTIVMLVMMRVVLMVMVIVLTIVTVESMMTVVMILKHGMGALHIGLETVGCLWKAIRNLFAHVCTLHTA